jgi:hypothetical protein
MVHKADIKSVFGPNKLVPNDRQAARKAVGNQNLTPGRYDVNESLNEEKKKGTQRALQKAQNEKSRQGDVVVINPVKPDALGQTYNQ